MSAVPVEIDLSPHGRVVIAGTDIASLVTALAVDSTADGMTRVYLTIDTRAAVILAPEAEVRIDADMHAVLVALGWTPPRGER